MSNQDGTPPIQANLTATPDMIASGLRSLLLAASAVASALGYVGWAGKFSALLLAVGPVAGAIAFVWSQYSTMRKSHKIATLVPYAPDDVAKFKGQ